MSRELLEDQITAFSAPKAAAANRCAKLPLDQDGNGILTDVICKPAARFFRPAFVNMDLRIAKTDHRERFAYRACLNFFNLFNNAIPQPYRSTKHGPLFGTFLRCCLP